MNFYSKTVPERLWNKIKLVDGCWEWCGRKSKLGYGEVWFGGKKLIHRVMYTIYHGGIPVGTELDHLCRNRACCNPFHLEATSHLENIRRGDGGNHNRSKTYCKRGHLFDDTNTYLSSKGRVCRACQRLHNANHRAKP